MFNFQINNRNWIIKELSQEEIKIIQNKRKANEEENIKSLNDRYYGITYTDIQEIYLDKDLPGDRKRATLIHELTHCYIIEHITHCDKTYDEEMVADIVSNSFDIIREIVQEYFDNFGLIKETVQYEEFIKNRENKNGDNI